MASDPTSTRASSVEVHPITDRDIQKVAEFLRAEFLSLGAKSTRPVTDWLATMAPPWAAEQPNHGYLLRDDGRVVGAHLALYSERVIDGRPQHFCNLAAWVVSEPYRASGLRLLRSLLRQKGYTFTDLTPNPNVVNLNTRLGFSVLDTTTVLVPNPFWPVLPRGIQVIDAADEIDARLSGPLQQIYRDHRTTAAHHVLLTDGARCCYVLYRRERYKHRSVLGMILYVSDAELFQRWSAHLYRYLLLKQRIIATLVEVRVVGHRPARSISVPGRTKMYLGEDIEPRHIDYLYSELTCLE